ncbi:MAG: hypothetical protein V7635_860 [Arthrobacter sp.]
MPIRVGVTGAGARFTTAPSELINSPLATALDGLRAAQAAEAMVAPFRNNGAYAKGVYS